MKITINDIKKSKVAHLNHHLFKEQPKGKCKIGGKIIISPLADSAEKTVIQSALLNFCISNGLKLYGEYRFHDTRRWRFDWAILGINTAFEFEGLIADKSRHTTIKGYSGDTEKYNEAANAGWRLYRYTALTYRNIHADLVEIMGKI